MATVTTTFLVDDIDGSTDDVETIVFELDKTKYEIDLSADNAARLRSKLAKFIDAATHIKPGRAGKAAKKVTEPTSRDQTQAVRDWARQNGFEISARGRVPRKVLDAFNAAH